MRLSLRAAAAASSAATISSKFLTFAVLLLLVVAIVPASSRPEDDDEPIMLEPEGGGGEYVHAVPDEATTYTGHAIQIDVLGNDYHADGTTSLVLDSIASDGRHGTCTVVGDIVTASVSQVLYEPDGGYSGSDECAYRACAADGDGGDECSVATISIIIAKQLEAAEFEYDVVVVDADVDAAEPSTEVADIVGNGTASGDPIGFDQIIDSCTPGEEVLLTLELQTDEHGGDVTWELREVVSSTTLRRFRRGGPYTRYSYDRVDVCVRSPGSYTFVIFDGYGDGMCDNGGGGGSGATTTCGYYRLYLDGREIVNVSHYGESNAHAINVGYDPSPLMSDRHVEYLDAHNARRRSWHEMHDVSYVPLLWSPGLAEDSARWAEALLDDCDSDDIEHETGVMEGENLAKNKGYEYEDGVPSWGQLYDPENIVGRWVDREIGWLYPKNAHLTQSLWRASKYLGCAESERDYNGGKCRVQVCRYAKAGNCDMTRYNSTEGENWLIPMLKGSSPCEPSCPPEGCF